MIMKELFVQRTASVHWCVFFFFFNSALDNSCVYWQRGEECYMKFLSYLISMFMHCLLVCALPTFMCVTVIIYKRQLCCLSTISLSSQICNDGVFCWPKYKICAVFYAVCTFMFVFLRRQYTDTYQGEVYCNVATSLIVSRICLALTNKIWGSYAARGMKDDFRMARLRMVLFILLKVKNTHKHKACPYS